MIGMGLIGAMWYWLDGFTAPRPFQAPSFGRVSRPVLIDPTLMLKPEGEPLRTLTAAQRAYGKRLRE